jgi:CRISPR-associated endonuclease/helicase Cas3
MEFIAHRREIDGEQQDLWMHLKETAMLSAKFASKIGLEKQGELIGLLHDLGKASKEFDLYIRSASGLIDPDADDYINVKEKKGKVDHSSAGAQYIYKKINNEKKENKVIAQILSLVLASHHSGLIDCLLVDGVDNFTRRITKEDKQTRLNECIKNSPEDLIQKIDEIIANNSFIADFNKVISSQYQKEEDSCETSFFKIGLLVKFLFSCLIDADRLNTADFEFPKNEIIRNYGQYKSWDFLIEKLNQHLSILEEQNVLNDLNPDFPEHAKKINFLRQDISNQCFEFSNQSKGVFQLTVPTGGGKTLASLRFALNHAKKYNMDRIIYIIPYTSIIDQNAQVVREILENKNPDGSFDNRIVLEHHSNLTPEEENTKQKLLSENWDAPIVFTTMVQFLESLFGHGTRNIRRFHQLANSILIFDEIQTIPIKCIYMFNVLMQFLLRTGGSTAVLSTATQPLLDKVKIKERSLKITSDHLIISNTQKLYQELKRVEIIDLSKKEKWDDSEIADLAREELNKTGSVLVIVNTKKSAINLFNLLSTNKNFAIKHLSTNMCPEHRMDELNTIKECLFKNNPIICISTQLIEAGVDIDFGSVIRYSAGLDSIAQAAGRCNRNGKRALLGRVLIVNPKDEDISKLSDIKLGKEQCEHILYEFKKDPDTFHNDLLNPKVMEKYYQYYFHERSNDMNYPVSADSVVGRGDNLFNLLAKNSLSLTEFRRINKLNPEILIQQSFMTASKAFKSIENSSRGIIVPYKKMGKEIISNLCSAKDTKDLYHWVKKAQRYSVNVYPNLLNSLLSENIIHETQEESGIYFLEKNYYSNDFGLSSSVVSEMETLYINEEV